MKRKNEGSVTCKFYNEEPKMKHLNILETGPFIPGKLLFGRDKL